MPSEQVAAAYAKLGLDDKEFDSGMDSAKSKFSSTTGEMESRATGMAGSIKASLSSIIAVAAPLAGVFSAAFALNSVIDFQEKSYSLERQSHLTGEALKQVTDYARNLSTTANQTTDSLMEVATTLASIDKSTDGLEKLTKSVADTSEISGKLNTDIADLDKAIAKAWGEGTPGILKLNNAAIGLKDAIGADETKTLSFVGTWGKYAQQVGETDTRTAAMGATFAALGVDGDSAMSEITRGTATLMTKIDSLTEASEKMSKATKNAPAQYTDAAKKAQSDLDEITKTFGESGEQIKADLDRDYYGTLVKLGGKLREHAGDLNALDASYTIFGRQGTQALISLGGGQDIWAKALKQANDETGNANAKTADLDKKAEELGTEIGNIVNIGKDIALTFGEKMATPIGKGLDLIIGVGQAVRGVLNGTQSLGDNVRNAFTQLNNLPGVEKVVAIAAGIATLVLVAGPFLSMMGGLAAMLITFINPVTIALAVVSALAAEFVNWDSVGKTAATTLEFLSNTVSTLWSDLSSGDWSKAFTDLQSAGQTASDAIQKFFFDIDWNKVWQDAKTKAITVFTQVKTTVQNTAKSIYDYFSKIDFKAALYSGITTLQAWLGTAIDFGKSVYDSITKIDWGSIKAQITSGLQSVLTFLTGIGQTIYSELSKIDWIKVGQDIWNGIKSLGTDISGIFSGVDWSSLGDKLIKGIQSGLSQISSIGQTIFNYLDNLRWDEVGQTAGKAIYGAISTGVNILSDLGKRISDYIDSGGYSSAGESIAKKLQTGLDTLKKWGSELASGIQSSGDWGNLGQKIGDLIKGGLAKITDWYSAIHDSIKTWADGTGAYDLGKQVGSRIADGFKALIDFGKYIYDNLTKKGNGDLVKGALETLADWEAIGLSIAGNFVTGFTQGITTPLNNAIGIAINSAFANAFDKIADIIPDIPGTGDIKANLHQSAQMSRAAIQTVYASPASTPTPSIPGASASPVVQSPAGAPAGAGSYNGQTVGDYMWTGDHWEYSPSTPSPSIPTQTAAPSTSSTGIIRNIATGLGSYTPEQLAMAVAKSGKFSSAGEAQSALSQYYVGTNGMSDNLSKIITDNFVAPIKQAATDSADIQKHEIKSMMDDTVRPPVKSMMDGLIQSGQSVYNYLTSAAKNALDLGSQVSSKFTNAGNAVSIGINAAGQQVAIIGDVAKQQWIAAGNQIVGGTTAGAQKVLDLSGQAGQAIQLSHSIAGDTAKSAANLAAGSTTSAATASASKTTVAGTGFKSSVDQGASVALSAISKAGDPASKLVIGAQYAANALVEAGQTLLSMASRSYSNSINWNLVSPSLRSFFGFASGTETSGPQMAMIGEDGPSYPEYVIPTKTKRWDLLYQALRAYGIGGFAEGTSTGDAGSDSGSNVIVSFGIPGITSAAKDIKRILGDLQSYFRTTWNIIKSDAMQNWISINSWLTGKLSEMSTSVSASAMSWRASLKSQMAAISSEQLQSWTQVSSQAKSSLQSISDFIISDNQQMAQNLGQGLNDISNAITSFSGTWQSTWQGAVGNFQTQAQDIETKIQEIIGEMTSLGSMEVSPTVNVNYTGGGSGGYGGSGDEGDNGGWLMEGGVCAPSNSPLPANVGPSVSYSGSSYSSSGSWLSGVGTILGVSSIRSFFAAKGADLTTPQMIVAAEKGPELVLPTDIRNTILDLTAMGFDKMKGGQVQEIHIHQHMNGREIAHQVFRTGVSEMRAKGLSIR